MLMKIYLFEGGFFAIRNEVKMKVEKGYRKLQEEKKTYKEKLKYDYNFSENWKIYKKACNYMKNRV